MDEFIITGLKYTDEPYVFLKFCLMLKYTVLQIVVFFFHTHFYEFSRFLVMDAICKSVNVIIEYSCNRNLMSPNKM